MLRMTLLLMCLVSMQSVWATVDNYWTGGGDGINWHSAANWSAGHVPVYNTDGSEKAYIGMNAVEDVTVEFTQYASYGGSPGNFYLGRDVDPSGVYNLIITSTGFFCNVYSYIGPQGVLDVNGGNYTTFGTKEMDGFVNVSNGIYKNRSYVWRISGYMTINAGSLLQIKNGTRFSETSGDITVPNSYFTGVIDLCGGEMQLDGDCTTAIAWHINNGNIKSHGNSTGLNYYYDSNTNCTYVTSTQVTNYWTGAGDGVTWGSGSNWSEGYVPVYNTNRSELAYLGMNATNDYTVEFYGNGHTVSPGDFYLGRSADPAGTYTLNVESGAYLYNVFLFVGSQGMINLNDGGLNCYGVKQLDGVMNINDGGVLTNRSYIWKIGGDIIVNVGGTLAISNGTRFSHCSTDITVPNSDFSGTIDLRGGQVRMQNDCTMAIAWHINNGNIVAYGGQGTVDYIYDSGINCTIVRSHADYYYFDSVNGNDDNPGTSPSQAWQSLSKFNSATFQPGDRIYFKAGCTWNGCMEIGYAWGPAQGSGTAADPIVVDAYGDISNENNKPRINGYPGNLNTLNIENADYWEINNLQLTNDGPSDGTGRNAVLVRSICYNQMNHIYLKDLYIHDVHGEDEGWINGGITLARWDADASTESYLNDILIEDCHFENVDNTAIHAGGGSIDPTEQQATNIVIRGNYFENLGGSSIIVCGTDGTLVEHNEVNGATGCGMWPWGAFNTLFQYNEVYNTVNEGDGNAYDCDYHCIGTIYQYNYSHDNPGGFMLICDELDDPIGNVNPIVRYNISVNDGSSSDSIFYLWKHVTNASIYNNFIYIPSGKDVHVVATGNTGGEGSLYIWNNNIFYSHGTARYITSDGSTSWWDNNCFYGTHKIAYLKIGDWIWWQDGHPDPDDNSNITSNPNVMSLSYGVGLDSISGYRLWSNSPCIGAGLAKYPGGEDFWGNPLFTGNPDIGPHEQ